MAARASSQSSQFQQTSGTIHYVSKRGNNQDGHSWQSAWNELNQIRWNQVRPGDTILIDGGIGEMTYHTPMDIQQSGANGSPILIQRASEPDRDGQIIIFGGRRDPLPYCFQQQANYQNFNMASFGIRTNHNSWITVDGREWRGIVIHGFERSGIRMDHNAHDISVRHVEIYNNGWADLTSQGWFPDGVGIRLAGYNVLVERTIIHDNGQDAIQSIWGDNNIRDLRINQSWFYNGRPHPTVDESSNYCTHTDGLQIYDGGLISGITIEESVMGPGFTNNLILGQTLTANGSKADVQNVTIRDTLFTKSADNGIFGYQSTDTRNWVLDNVTMHCPKTKWHCLQIDNPGHTVQDSIVYGSRITFEDGISSYSNNCMWDTEGQNIGTNANPVFVNVSDANMFSQDDYSLAADSQCAGKGSKITSVRQLLQLGDSAPVHDSTQPAPTQPAPTPTQPEPAPTQPAPTSPAPTPTPEPTQPLPTPSVPVPAITCGGLAQEAEAGQLYGMFTVGSDSQASGGSYVSVPDFSGNRGRVPDAKQRVEFCVRVDAAGIYELQGWSYAESGYDNSFYIQIDGQPSQAYLWHSPISMSYPGEIINGYNPSTNQFAPIEVNLNEGIHTVTFYLREDGTRLDRFALAPVNESSNRDVDITDYLARLVNDISIILENMVESVFIPFVQ